MALKALNVGTTWEYISRLDPAHPDQKKPKGEPTVFTLRVLDSFVMGRINDQVTEFDTGNVDPSRPDAQVDLKTKINMSVAAIEACRFGIEGITNFKDDDDKDLFETREVTLPGSRKYTVVVDPVLGRIKNAVLNELFQELQTQNTVSEDEEKNSGGSSSASNSSPKEGAKAAPRPTSGSGAATPAS